MQPSLRDGDRVLVRWGAPVRPGDVAVVRLPPDHAGRARPLSVKRAVRPEAGGWWVERDNPAEGVDSWQVGAVPADGVLAVVRWRLWPRPGRPPGDPRAAARPPGADAAGRG